MLPFMILVCRRSFSMNTVNIHTLLMSKLEHPIIWSFLVHWEHGSWRTELNIQILIQAKLGGNIRNDWYDINRDVTYLCHDLIPYSVPVEHNELSWNKIDPFQEEHQLICFCSFHFHLPISRVVHTSAHLLKTWDVSLTILSCISVINVHVSTLHHFQSYLMDLFRLKPNMHFLHICGGLSWCECIEKSLNESIIASIFCPTAIAQMDSNGDINEIQFSEYRGVAFAANNRNFVTRNPS